ncbi:DUF461 domain-containing protein [Streptomyces tubbatahanensis]|uniref:DUF461 domain-containing protein n=1 Tax=Streptomyces tubbatahanensis TaxID=2923272 RepID=A0ABY3XT59_9ACTN|nr:DUF461 domain-containing protein [Streptomyces tubbatahanensis]UNS97676.1 DUF461 domain-containing protein [Streptomyces tubbatahanensis]
MSSSLRRGTLAATTLALAAISLTACGAGNDAQTLEIKPDNAATHVGTIKIQNANVVTGTHGTGEATVTARIFNDGTKDQTLKGVSVSGTRAELSPAKGERKLVVPAGGSLELGGKGEASALLTDAKRAGVRDGNAQQVTFDLSSTGAVKLKAAVFPAKGAYKTVGPSASPSSQGPKPGSSASSSKTAGPGDKPGEGGEGQEGGTGSGQQQEQGRQGEQGGQGQPSDSASSPADATE